MNICVYGSSSDDIDKKYIEATERLGELMAEHGHGLVFGGGARGLMGAVARGVVGKNGNIIGVAPGFFNVDGVLFDKCTEFIITDTMRERKAVMEDRADAFIVTPGGMGTFEEFFEILTLKELGRHGKAIVIFNIDGYYDKLIQMLEESVEKKFMVPAIREIYTVLDDEEEILKYLEGYKNEVGRVFKF